jgi:hypothetical protein
MRKVIKHVPSPPPAPGQATLDLMGKSTAWLCDNAKKGIRRDEGGPMLSRQIREIPIGFSNWTLQQQADWVLGEKYKLVQSIHARIDPYLDELKMRAVGR